MMDSVIGAVLDTGSAAHTSSVKSWPAFINVYITHGTDFFTDTAARAALIDREILCYTCSGFEFILFHM